MIQTVERKQWQQEQQRQEIIERFEDLDDIGGLSAGVIYQLNQIMRAYEPEKVKADEQTDVFNSISTEYGDDADGFVFYQIPEEYQRTGGSFPEKVQVYTYCLCRQNGVSYPLIVAMIEHESGYVFDRVGDDGNSFGYMQIYEKWHTDRMEELGCTDLLNPYQNICVGVDYISELIDKYGTIQDALAAYNCGGKGAREHLWGKGIYVYSYNEAIIRRMKGIEEDLRK